MKPREISVCGLAAVRALFERDPEAIRRLFFDEPTSKRLGAMTSALAKLRRVYRLVNAEELEKISGTVHHGGVVAVIEEPMLGDVTEPQLEEWVAKRAPLLILDRIGNSHNLGAIARTAAFFGVEAIIIPDVPEQALPSESAYRIAEGGLQYVSVWRVQDLAFFCSELAKRYDVLGASVSAGTQSVAGFLAERSRSDFKSSRQFALVLGNEETGLSTNVAAACTAHVHLPGRTDRVESLNVSVAAGILMWEIWGRRLRR
ncbi:MAG TPA: RNA methyltransferase [Opitutaceae bacterium]